MKLAAAISALGLFALVAAASGDANARPPDPRDRGDTHPHGRMEGGPHGGPQGETHGRGGPGSGPYGQQGGQPGQYRPPARHVPLETVVSQMRRRYPGGHLLDADLQDRGGRTVYHVHWATGDGRRIDYIVDAETGQVLGQED